MADFRCHFAGTLKTKFDRRAGFRVITSNAIQEMWGDSAYRDMHGVYVFAIKGRGPGFAVPFYVGLAKHTTFGTETFNPRNRGLYTAALLQREGTPEIHLLVYQAKPGPSQLDDIDDLETLMIWAARFRNPSLINKVKVDASPAHLMSLFSLNTIHGVLNSGRGAPGQHAEEFRGVMGL